MSISRGWFNNARKVVSPNFNQRPDQEDISLLVIHNISLPPGQFGGDEIELFFSNRLDCSKHPYFAEIEGLEVSAHFLVRRCGEIVQFVACDDRAWHAGVSSFQGRENCNDFSIGVELEGCDDLRYTEEQYLALRELTKVLMEAYPKLNVDRICGHADIAPKRKTDPGEAFDWIKYLGSLS